MRDRVKYTHLKGRLKEYNTAHTDYKIKTSKDCVELVMECMRETRSDVKEYLGIYIGSQLGVCIIPHFMLDHSGTTFKGVMTLVHTEQSKTLNCE